MPDPETSEPAHDAQDNEARRDHLSADRDEDPNEPGPATETIRGKRDGWRLLWQFVRRHRWGIAAGMLVSLGWSGGRIVTPLLVQMAIDRGIDGDEPLLRWALFICAAGGISAIFFGLRRYLAFRNARLIEAELRDRLFAHIQRLHFSFHDTNATGDLMSRANTDLQQFQDIVTIIPINTGNAVMVLGATIVMLTISPVLTLFALGALPLVNVFGRMFATRLFPAIMGVQRESAELATVVEETVAGVRVVKGFGAEPVRRAALATEARDLYGESMRAAMSRARFLPAMDTIPNIGLIAVLAYGGHQVLRGNLTIGELVSFNIYVTLLVQPLRMLGMAVVSGQRASAAGARIHEVLATAPAIVAPDSPDELPDIGPRGHVDFSGVSFAYDDAPNERVLHNLSLTIEPGESVAIVGATGSGKTTVASLLPRFYEATAGTIRLDGVDVRTLSPQHLRRAVSIVFEETFLFDATIGENIAFAEPDASMDRVRAAAVTAGADEFINELPEGYDTVIGERGFSLSGGQRQRIAIARAILADPRVLVLDDATSAVDPTKEHEIRDALGAAMAERTTIVIAHRPATVALADRVVLIDEGSVAAEGTHAELLAGNTRYRNVLAAGTADQGAN